jgi:hypothetical protein
MKQVPVVVPVILIALWLPVLVTIGSLAGCQAGTTGPLRPMTDDAYQTTTNVVRTVVAAGTTLSGGPGPVIFDTFGAAVLALLAAWQGLTTAQLRKIQAETTTNKPKEKQ